ncbi:receptor-like protein kinase [Seminavis robusta]|uniref:Receptor-like protein kinase n=1 Tax=Seminavis robusta TaxID=568900 RepID=A0A9N8HPJ7_9STRA|nr:receptor-like protein kinase [Seminavis robusta]|eukprot:Sro907_g218760.1 receptor-like protein kinase (1137) ;mRNA; r:22070-26685
MLREYRQHVTPTPNNNKSQQDTPATTTKSCQAETQEEEEQEGSQIGVKPSMSGKHRDGKHHCHTTTITSHRSDDNQTQQWQYLQWTAMSRKLGDGNSLNPLCVQALFTVKAGFSKKRFGKISLDRFDFPEAGGFSSVTPNAVASHFSVPISPQIQQEYLFRSTTNNNMGPSPSHNGDQEEDDRRDGPADPEGHRFQYEWEVTTTDESDDDAISAETETTITQSHHNHHHYQDATGSSQDGPIEDVVTKAVSGGEAADEDGPIEEVVTVVSGGETSSEEITNRQQKRSEDTTSSSWNKLEMLEDDQEQVPQTHHREADTRLHRHSSSVGTTPRSSPRSHLGARTRRSLGKRKEETSRHLTSSIISTATAPLRSRVSKTHRQPPKSSQAETKEEGEEEQDASQHGEPLVGAINVRHNSQTGIVTATRRLQVTESRNIPVETRRGIAVANRSLFTPPTETATTRTNLAMATLVLQDETTILPLAQELFNNNHRRNNTRLKYRFLLYFAVGLVLLVGIPLLVFFVVRTFTGANDEEEEFDATSIEGMMDLDGTKVPIEEYILSLLPQDTISSIIIDSSNDDEMTAQSKAFRWVLEDPILMTYEPWRIIQRFALATLYYATEGDQWLENTDWLSYTVHEALWYNVDSLRFKFPRFQQFFELVFNYDGDALEHLWLSGNRLRGTIPDEVYLLTSVRTMDLSINQQLGGTLASQVANLDRLEILLLYTTGLTGTIPTEIGLMETTYFWLLLGNSLTGTLPSEVGQLRKSWFFTVDHNKLTGTLPTELGLLTDMHSLWLFSNQFSGSIPSTLGQLTTLQSMGLNDNKLSGTIPKELQSLFGPPKFSLYVDTIVEHYPDVALASDFLLAGLRPATHLLLQRNQLTGTLPKLPSELHVFGGHENQLTGTLSADLAEATNLVALTLWANPLTGTVPSQLGLISDLRYLFLNHCILTGSIATEMQQLLGLRVLLLANNALSGTIHEGFSRLFASETRPCCDIEALPYVGTELDLSHNLMAGPLPTRLGPKLVRFAVAWNQLTGTIAPRLGRNDLLQYFDAGHNLLSGTLPSHISRWTTLKEFNVASNRLTGSIPSEIGELVSEGSNATIFDLSNNSFTGTLPSSLCRQDMSSFLFSCTDVLCGCDCPC